MNNYSKLITSHMISFKEVLVKNYKKIKLNETEAMIIILLYEQRKHNNIKEEAYINLKRLKEMYDEDEFDDEDSPFPEDVYQECLEEIRFKAIFFHEHTIIFQ